jgi:hypothetical protein
LIAESICWGIMIVADILDLLGCWFGLWT